MINAHPNDSTSQNNDKSNSFDVENSIKIYFITFSYEVSIDFDPKTSVCYVDINASIAI